MNRRQLLQWSASLGAALALVAGSALAQSKPIKIGVTAGPHAEIMEEVVTSFNMWVCARKGHPTLTDRCTLEQYLECEHIFVAQGSPGSRVAPSLIPLDYALQQRGLKRNSTMTVHGWRTQAEVATQTDMIFTVNSLMKDLVCKMYDLNAFPLPAELETVLGLNMLWHRSRNTHPMLVWARNLFKQVVAEYTGQGAVAPAHSSLPAAEPGKAGKSGKGGHYVGGRK